MNKLNYAKLYFDKRMKRIFLFGFMSGFPWVIIGSALSLWLKENDLSDRALLLDAVYVSSVEPLLKSFAA